MKLQRMVAIMGIAVLLGTACGAPAEDSLHLVAASPPSQTAPSRPAVLHIAAAQPADGAELRIALERLLGQHATLAVRSMRARVDGDEAFASVAIDALVTNTEQLTDIVESVYGADGAAAFEQLWSDHGNFLFDYTFGVVDDNDAARRQARADLDAYAIDFAAFMESATDGELVADDLEGGLGDHIDHLLDQIDAYAAGDYERSFAQQRQAYEHMFPTGRSLADGIAAHHPGELPIPVDDAPQQLRSTLGLLLGEHVELAIDAMRAGVAGALQFEAAAAALNANTDELTAAMDGLFGAERAAAFNTLWADHIDAFVQYTAALADDDEAGRDEARSRLDDFHHELGAALGEMTGGRLPADAAAEALRIHDEQLVDQIEAYADEDYEAAYQIAFDAYQHVFDTAAALAEAIEAHVGPELPVGGAPTGGGGMASDHGG